MKWTSPIVPPTSRPDVSRGSLSALKVSVLFEIPLYNLYLHLRSFQITVASKILLRHVPLIVFFLVSIPPIISLSKDLTFRASSPAAPIS